MTYVVDVLCVAVPFDSVFEIEVIQIQLLDLSLPWPVLGCLPQGTSRTQIPFLWLFGAHRFFEQIHLKTADLGNF